MGNLILHKLYYIKKTYKPTRHCIWLVTEEFWTKNCKRFFSNSVKTNQYRLPAN